MQCEFKLIQILGSMMSAFKLFLSLESTFFGILNLFFGEGKGVCEQSSRCRITIANVMLAPVRQA